LRNSIAHSKYSFWNGTIYLNKENAEEAHSRISFGVWKEIFAKMICIYQCIAKVSNEIRDYFKENSKGKYVKIIGKDNAPMYFQYRESQRRFNRYLKETGFENGKPIYE